MRSPAPMIKLVATRILPAAYDLLPSEMAFHLATRELLAIMWQESRGRFRAQIGGGPARGLWQFEAKGGVKGVMRHPSTSGAARAVLDALGYVDVKSPHEVWPLLEHNDVLAAAFARLLLWTLPDPLPVTAEEGWAQYLKTWRPGKPIRTTWDEAWRQAGDALW